MTTLSRPDLSSASDTGLSDQDDVTAVERVVLSGGGAAAGAFVTIVSDVDGELGTVEADENGNWSFTTPALSEAPHLITAQTGDEISPALSLRIDGAGPIIADLTAPRLSDAADPDGDGVTSQSAPVLVGETEPNGFVYFFAPNTAQFLGIAVADETGAYSFTPNAGLAREGEVLIFPVFADQAGNAVSGGGVTLSFTLDMTAAAPSLVFGAGDAEVISLAEAQAFPVVLQNAEAGSTFEVTITSGGGPAPITITGVVESAVEDVTFVDISGLGDGPLVLTLDLTDPAGNTTSGLAFSTLDLTTPRVIVERLDDVVIGEGSDAVTAFSVALNRNPAAPVFFSAQGDSEVTVGAFADDLGDGANVFLNDTTPVTIFVRARQDGRVEGEHSGFILFDDLISADPDFDGFSPEIVSVGPILDDEPAALTVAADQFAALAPLAVPVIELRHTPADIFHYTAFESEAEAVVAFGFDVLDEDAFFALPREFSGQGGSVDVFRLFNPFTGDHLFTTSAAERDAAIEFARYLDEGVAFAAFTEPGEGLTPVYRLLAEDNFAHIYTTSQVERDALLADGHVDEGIAFYAFALEDDEEDAPAVVADMAADMLL